MKPNRRRVVWALLGLLLVAAAIIGVGVGPVPVPPGETLDALIRLLAGQPESSPADAIVRIRLPRIALSAVVGAGLAASGAALQGLFRNAMADPYLLGISAGGALGATLAIALGLGITTLGLAPVPLFAFLGALAAAWAVYALGKPAPRVYRNAPCRRGVERAPFRRDLLPDRPERPRRGGERRLLLDAWRFLPRGLESGMGRPPLRAPRHGPRMALLA